MKRALVILAIVLMIVAFAAAVGRADTRVIVYSCDKDVYSAVKDAGWSRVSYVKSPACLSMVVVYKNGREKTVYKDVNVWAETYRKECAARELMLKEHSMHSHSMSSCSQPVMRSCSQPSMHSSSMHIEYYVEEPEVRRRTVRLFGLPIIQTQRTFTAQEILRQKRKEWTKMRKEEDRAYKKRLELEYKMNKQRARSFRRTMKVESQMCYT